MQRTDQREWDADQVAGPAAGEDADSSTREAGGGVRGRLGRLFSPRAFLLALVLSLVGLFLGGAVPVVGFVGRYVGLFAAAFLLALVAERRRYLEVGLAGGLASGLGFVLSAVTSAFFPFAVSLLAEYGVAVAGVGAGVGLLVSVAGHYFGRDLRDGLTREV